MNEREAIKAIRLDGIQMEGKAVRMLEFYEGLAMAEEALKKQIPKKPLENIVGFYCSECKHFVESVSNYCEHCGQKLDWTVEE